MSDQKDSASARGRPTLYKPEFVAQAQKLCELGAIDIEIADFFEIHVGTLYRWKHEHEEFCEALKIGKTAADERVERSLYQKATGFDYIEQQAIKVKRAQHEEGVEVVEVRRHMPADTGAACFWLKNRRKDDWKDRQTLEGGDGGPLEVRIVRHGANGHAAE